MIHFLYHWIYQDLWVPVWPNWFAGLVGFIIASVLVKKALKKLHKKLDRNHEATKLLHEHLGIGEYKKIWQNNSAIITLKEYFYATSKATNY